MFNRLSLLFPFRFCKSLNLFFARAFFFLFLFVSFVYSASVTSFVTRTFSDDRGGDCSQTYPYSACVFPVCSIDCQSDGTTLVHAGMGDVHGSSVSVPASCNTVNIVSQTGSCSGSGTTAWFEQEDPIHSVCKTGSYAVSISWSQNSGSSCFNTGTPVNVSCTNTCTYSFPGVDLPQCSEFLPVPAPACKGGQGLWVAGDDNAFAALPGDGPCFIGEWTLGMGGIIDRPDGSRCEYDSPSSVGRSGYCCPLGLADDESSSSSAAGGPSSSSAGGSLCDDPEELINNPACACRLNPSDPSCNYDVCERYPSLYGCQPDTIASPNICDAYPGLPGCGNFPGDTLRGGMGGLGSGDVDTVGTGGGTGPGGGDSGGNTVVGGVVGAGGNCTSLSNCDWSKLSVQLQHLGVDVETRDLVRDLLQGNLVLSDINYRQENLLRDVNDALSDGFGGLSDSLSGFKGLLGSLLDSVSGGLSGLRSSLDSGFSGLSGDLSRLRDFLDSGFAGLPDAVADGLKKWGSDTSGSRGFGDSLAGWGSGGFGGTGSQMGDSLGDGSVLRGKIRSAVGIDSSAFSFLGNGGACPVINASFNSGVYSISNSKNINLCDIYGYNVASVLRAILWLIVLTTSLFMDLQILKTGGRS